MGSDWARVHREFVVLKEIFQKNSYQISFIDNSFKKFLNNSHIVKPTLVTVEKKPLLLILPYLGTISLQVRTKIRCTMKGTLNCCKLQVIFRCETKLSNMFRLKDCVRCKLV